MNAFVATVEPPSVTVSSSRSRTVVRFRKAFRAAAVIATRASSRPADAIMVPEPTTVPPNRTVAFTWASVEPPLVA